MGEKVNVMSDKPFMTYEQQLDKLINDKGLQIKDRDYAIKLLKNHSYFDLISGYKKPFKDKNDRYKLHTSIEDIYALYCFDDEIRTVFLRYILKVEKKIKSLISYSFCDTYGAEQAHYLNATKYDYIPQNQDEINELIGKLGKIIADPKNYPYIIHQKNCYSNVPLWVLMKALTLGTVSKMYSFLPQSIQCKVSIEFPYVNEGMLAQMLDLLARVRNVCAHNERLYSYRYRTGAIDDTDMHKMLAITKKKGQYIKGKQDVYAVVIVLKYLLEDEDFCVFIDSIKSSIDRLFQSTKTIGDTQLYKYMGFPDNWMEIKRL